MTISLIEAHNIGQIISILNRLLESHPLPSGYVQNAWDSIVHKWASNQTMEQKQAAFSPKEAAMAREIISVYYLYTYLLDNSDLPGGCQQKWYAVKTFLDTNQHSVVGELS